VNDRLLQTAVIFLGGCTQLGVKVGRKSYRHSPTNMASRGTVLVLHGDLGRCTDGRRDAE
jgi:hypothetical protein